MPLQALRGMEEFATPERPLPFVERPERSINVMLWVKIGSAVAALLIAFFLVYFVIGRVRTYLAAKTALRPAPAPVVTAPPPAPKANSIFDEGYTAPSSKPPALASTQALPKAEAPPAPAITVIPPVMPKRVENKDPVTDKAIEQAIQRGANYLLEQVKTGTLTPKEGDVETQMEGRFAFCVLALLHAGRATFDERLQMSSELMPMLVEKMKKMPMNENTATYARAIRAMALSVHDRRVDRAALKGDMEYLLKSSVGGFYSYSMPKTEAERTGGHFDNSNSQYGVLGVWAAADAGLPVPTTYWEEIEAHWTKTQQESGAWAYGAGYGDPRLSMTAGGITSLFVAGDQLASTRMAKGVDASPYKPALEKGLKWLSEGDNAIRLQSQEGYCLYALERAGLASGYKRFGKHDWYRELSAKVLKDQREDGAWPGADGTRPETCDRVLFLSRGRHPILLNKLRFDGAWANRPRDAVRLADFVFSSIERPVNWQVVNLSDGWREWMDAPIAYISSHAPVPVTDENVKQLRAYIQAGGLLFTHADADSKEFSDFVEVLAKQLFPQYEMRDLPLDHPIYSMIYRITGDKTPPLRGLSNGTRLLMVHSPTDLAADWQNRLPKTKPIPFQLGANIFVYTTGKAPLRNRLDTPLVPDVTDKPLATFTIARVRHAGNWDPEPGAWERMSKWFRRETSIQLNVVPTEAAALRRLYTPFAHVTTTAAWKPSEAELTAFRNFVREGGLLLLDPCGGSQELATSLQRDIAQAAFPDEEPRDVSEKDQFIGGTGAGMDELTRPLMRVYAVEQLENKIPPMQIMPVGKGWIVISKLDLVSGLLGTNTWGILGYDPNYAQALMKNLVLYACNGRTFNVEVPTTATAPSVEPPPDPGMPNIKPPPATVRTIEPPPDPGSPTPQ